MKTKIITISLLVISFILLLSCQLNKVQEDHILESPRTMQADASTKGIVIVPKRVYLNKKFNLTEGNLAYETSKGIQFTFQKVISDSRCPINARCLVPGEARIRVKIQVGAKIKSRVMTTKKSKIKIGKYMFEFIDLLPHPVLPSNKMRPRYVGQFIIKAKKHR